MAFLIILQQLIPKYLTQRKYFLMLKQLARFSPLVMFHKVLPASGVSFLQYLSDKYQNDEIFTEFSLHFIQYLTQSKEQLARNQDLACSCWRCSEPCDQDCNFAVIQ